MQQGNQISSIYGIYFCSNCNNMMIPYKANGSILEFKCAHCDIQELDFSNRTEKGSLLYSKQLHGGAKRFAPDSGFIFDPTMPRVQVSCPQCDFNQAVYFLTPGEGERKIVVKLMCANATETTVKCGHSWELQDEDFLYKDQVRSGMNK